MAAKKKSWKELTGRQKAATLGMVAVQLALQTAALKDLKKRPAAQINGPKAAWAAAILVNFMGSIVYFLKGRKKA